MFFYYLITPRLYSNLIFSILNTIGFTGADALSMDTRGLAQMFAGETRAARREEEGVAWTLEADVDDRQAALAFRFKCSLQREHALALHKLKLKESRK